MQRAGWICAACSSGYPVIGEVPWLFAEPRAALAEWCDRLHFLLLELEREARILRAELDAPDRLASTRRRLELLATANEDHARRLRDLLAPLGLADVQTSYETHLALRTRLPADQGLTNYYVNVHRDWVWGDEENAASLALIRSTAGDAHDWGITVVLGAGAGRLAYDVHMSCVPRFTVAVDFNPLLLFVARDMARGESLQLYEFPIAPRTIEDHALLRTLRAPAAARPGFFTVGADVLRAPFVGEAIDTVVTPWLIDIIDEDFARFAARVNGMLRPGGCWINFGSLSFSQGERAWRLSREEVVELLESAGFEDLQLQEATIPYMRCPSSRHSRLETVVVWRARKARTVPPPGEHSVLPDWLVHADRPVPLLEDFRVQAVSTRIHAFLMSLIDGRRSLRDIARLLVEQRLMTPQDAEPAVRRFLTRMYEDSRRRAGY